MTHPHEDRQLVPDRRRAEKSNNHCQSHVVVSDAHTVLNAYQSRRARRRVLHAQFSLDNCLGCLTVKQRQVLSLLSFGFSNKEIAGMLSVAECTVKAHLSEIFKIFRCTNRTHLALTALCIRQCLEPRGILRANRITASHDQVADLANAFEVHPNQLRVRD